MKRILILCLSSEIPPYDRMIETAQRTWDSVEVENMETIFYCGKSEKTNTDKIVYLNVDEGLLNLGHKTLSAFIWALSNKQFDYIARVHSSIYVNKIKLKEYVENLPETNVFDCIPADSQNGFKYGWGGLGYVISKDVIEKIVDNQNLWPHKYMEDESMSLLVAGLGIPFRTGYAAGIDKKEIGWQCISYGGESIEFQNFEDLKRLGHHYYRVKNDGLRHLDEHLMNELFKSL